MKNYDDELAAAQKLMDAAQAKREVLTANQTQVIAAREAIAGKQADIVTRISNGESFTAVEIAKVDAELLAAQSHVEILTRALAERDKDIEAAQAEIDRVMNNIAQVTYIAAVDEREAAAAALDEAGAVFAVAVARFQSSTVGMCDAFASGRPLMSHEDWDLKEHRNIAAAVPAEVQWRILQTGSVYAYSLHANQKNTWGPSRADARRQIRDAS